MCMHQTLVIPTSQVSAVQVAAYKKYILVSLLYQGEVRRIIMIVLHSYRDL